jgi:putative CocE/NonD family hydrolase
MRISGIETGQRRLNWAADIGRDYRKPFSAAVRKPSVTTDVPALMRDGVELLCDVYRPTAPGTYPVLVAASPYPRQIQNMGAPLGFLEAGASDFFVPRGTFTVIANCRGTGGSGGVFGFFDSQERRDMHDLVEWAAVQPWSDGNVGMLGISYFAMTQMEAAVERPPHFESDHAVGGSFDLYEAATHHGLVSSSFMTPFLFISA